MDISVASHAKRKLRRLDRYEHGSQMKFCEEPFCQNVPPAYGAIVGVYRNDFSGNVVLTTDGLLVPSEGDGQFVAYSEISHVLRNREKDCEDDAILLQLHSGSTVVLQIEGKDLAHGTHDKYEVMMFLESAISVSQPSAE